MSVDVFFVVVVHRKKVLNIKQVNIPQVLKGDFLIFFCVQDNILASS